MGAPSQFRCLSHDDQFFHVGQTPCLKTPGQVLERDVNPKPSLKMINLQDVIYKQNRDVYHVLRPLISVSEIMASFILGFK